MFKGYPTGTNDVSKGYYGMLMGDSGPELHFLNKNDKVLSNEVIEDMAKKINIDPLKDKPVIDLSKGKHIIINEGVVRSTKKK